MPVQICFPFIGDTIGGSHRSALLLIENLPASYQPVIVLHQEGAFSAFLREKGIPYLKLPIVDPVGRFTFFRQMRALMVCTLKVIRFFLKHPVDIVHTHDGRTHLTWCLACRIMNKRHVWHQRTVLSSSRLLRACIRLAGVVISPSHFLKNTFPKKLKKNTYVIMNPFAVPKTMPKKNPSSQIRILYLANYADQKQPRLFLNLAAALNTERPDCCEFMMAGRGIPEVLHDEAPAMIQLLDFQSEPSRLYEKADLLVSMGLNESFGRVIVEAMLAGVAVVASRSGGHVELVDEGRTGLLAEASSIKDYLTCCLQYIDCPNRIQTMTIAAYQWAANCCSVDQHIKQILSIYQESRV